MTELHELFVAPEQDEAEAQAMTDAVVSTWSSRRRRRSLRPLVALAAALLLGVAWWLVTPREEAREVTPAASVAQSPQGPVEDRVLAAPGTLYTLAGTHGDRVVELVDGRVYCEVEHRAPGERFRVAVGADVVEVTGTRFGVTARDGALQTVQVDDGRVRVQLESGETLMLTAGGRWGRSSRPSTPPPVREPSVPPPSPVDPPPPPVGSSLKSGLDALDRGAFDQALIAFAEEAEQPELREDAAFWRAVTLVRAGRTTEAEAALRGFRRDHEASPRTGQASCLLGRLLDEGDRPEEAREAFSAAAESADPRAAACGSAALDLLPR